MYLPIKLLLLNLLHFQHLIQGLLVDRVALCRNEIQLASGQRLRHGIEIPLKCVHLLDVL